MIKPKLEIQIGDVIFKNPVTVASGTWGTQDEYASFVDYRKLGAIITKTITLKPRIGNPMPRICEVTGGMLNAIGLQNKGLEDFLENKIPYFSKIGTPLIVNIAGESTQDFSAMVKALDQKKKVVRALELNLSCPNVEAGGAGHMKKRERILDIVKAVRDQTDLVVFAKLSPELGDVIEIAKSVVGQGVSGLTLINTLKGMAIDIRTRKPKLANVMGGLSGPAIKPVALRYVYEVKREMPEIPVIGVGGIASAADALEFLMAGADLVAVGTANFVSPRTTLDVVKGIQQYLIDNRIDDIHRIRGLFRLAMMNRGTACGG